MTALSVQRSPSWSEGSGLLGALAIFFAAYAPMYSLFGKSVSLLCLIPVVVAAMDFGSRGALLATAASFPLNLFLLFALGEDSAFPWFSVLDGVIWFAVLVVGLATGYHCDLSRKKREDLEHSRQVEEDLEDTLLKLERLKQQVHPRGGVVAICVHCMRVKDHTQEWQPFSTHLTFDANTHFVRSVCPECEEELTHRFSVRSR